MSTLGSVLTPPTRRRRSRLSRWWWILAATVALIVVLLAVAQIVLPGLAENRLRTQLSRHGQVLSLSISAFPAVELLWNQADSVSVSMASYTDQAAGQSGGAASQPARSSLQRLADFLARTAHTDVLHASAGSVQAGHLLLTNVVLTKQDGQLTAVGDVATGAIQAALPGPFTLRPLDSSSGGLVFRGGARVAGVHTTLVARLRARHGALVVQPDVFGFFPSILSLTVFHDPRIYVESVESQRQGSGWQITAQARLTGQ